MVTILQELINNVIDDRRLAAIAAVQGNEPDKMMSATTELQNALCALQELCLLQKSQNAKQDQINKLADRCAELEKLLAPDISEEGEALQAQEDAAAQEAIKEWVPGKVEKHELAQLWKTAFRDGWNACRKYHHME